MLTLAMQACCFISLPNLNTEMDPAAKLGVCLPTHFALHLGDADSSKAESQGQHLHILVAISDNASRSADEHLVRVQEVEYVKQEAKLVYLLECLQKTAPPVLIFAEKTKDVDDIHEYLLIKGVEAVAVHGGKDQEDREQAIDSFKGGRKDVLVATDVASKVQLMLLTSALAMFKSQLHFHFHLIKILLQQVRATKIPRVLSGIFPFSQVIVAVTSALLQILMPDTIAPISAAIP